MFDKAKKIAGDKPAKKSEKAEVNLEGLKNLAEIDALIKSLSTIRDTLDKEVKEEGFNHFLEIADGKKPENFKGIDDIASASIEMRKRSSASPLTEDEIKLLDEHKLPYEKKVATVAMFGINPIYTTDKALLKKVEKALEKIVPEDFIVEQEEVSKTVVAEDTLDKAFAADAPSEVIKMLSVMAIKPKLETVDIKLILKNVTTLLTLDETLADIADSKEAKPAVKSKAKAKILA